jgi:hypothetical protein
VPLLFLLVIFYIKHYLYSFSSPQVSLPFSSSEVEEGGGRGEEGDGVEPTHG